MVLFAWVEYLVWGKDQRAFWWVKLAGILLGLILIPVIYYTYTGILGVSADWFNITIFFLAAAAAYRTETALFHRGNACPAKGKSAVFAICLLTVLFVVLTFVPPGIPFFEDPVTGTYGFPQKHPGSK